MRYASLLLLSLLVACSGSEESVRQRFLAQSTVSVQFENWVRAFNNQDMDSLALAYHRVPELRVLHSDRTISRGWVEEMEKRAEFFESAELVNLVAEGLEIDVRTNDVVLTTFSYTLDVARTDGERDPAVAGLGSIVWTQDPADELWKIYLMQLSAR